MFDLTLFILCRVGGGVKRSARLKRVEDTVEKMDVGVSQQKMISILVKTPNQAQEDQTVHGVYVTWTVKELKTHLSTVYPTKPVSYESGKSWLRLASVATVADSWGLC